MTSKLIDSSIHDDDQWDGTDIEPGCRHGVAMPIDSVEDDQYKEYLTSYREGDKFS